MRSSSTGKRGLEKLSMPIFGSSFALTLSDREVWMVASEFIERYSEFATVEAAKQADWFLQKGDLAGQRNWLRVVKGIASMTAANGETAN